MNHSLRVLGCVVALLLSLSSSVRGQAQPATLEQAEEQAFKQAAAFVGPSVVRIDTVGGLDVVGELLTSTAPTTGLIISADGFLVSSAFNFISKPTSILVLLPDGRRLPAKLIATDRLRMISLLKIDAENLPIPKVAAKSTFRVGQWSIALGRTYDSPQPAMSVGIVSAVNRMFGRAVQTDAKVSPINYGGPLVDIEGRVLGVLAPLSPEDQSEAGGVEWYDSGIGFAVPLEDIYQVLEQLKRGTDLRRGLLGVRFKTRNLFDVPEITSVSFDSPAAKVGLKRGDIIIEAGGKPVTRLGQVREASGTKLEGDSIKLVVKRGEQTLPFEVTLVGELKPYESAFLGVLPERGPIVKDAVTQETGVGVRSVYADSAAAKLGLQPRDRLLKFNGTELTTAVQLADLISRIRPGEDATLDYLQAGKTKTAAFKLGGVLNVVPAELTSSVIPAPKDKPAGDAAHKTGRFTGKLPGYESEFWAFVPSDYNAAYGYSLLVWLHPSRDAMEATIYQEWKTICERRGVILVSPKAADAKGWTPNEVEFIKDVTRHFKDKYSIDAARVAVHGFREGAVMATHVAFKFREEFRGIAMCGAPLQMAPPENEPDLRLQFHLTCGDRDPLLPVIKKVEKRLVELKFPTTLRTIKDLPAKYPSGETVEEIARWLDALDRM